MPADADRIAVDTSVAIPLVLRGHPAHDAVTSWWSGRPLSLSGHAAIETYSVLTRLPGDARLDAADAARLLEQRFAGTVLLNPTTTADLPRILATAGVHGGAVYDAIVGLAASENGHALATRDARAVAAYEAIGARIILVPS